MEKLNNKLNNIEQLKIELSNLQKKYETFKSKTKSKVESAYKNGLGESINQINFLQNQVMTFKNYLAQK